MPIAGERIDAPARPVTSPGGRPRTAWLLLALAGAALAFGETLNPPPVLLVLIPLVLGLALAALLLAWARQPVRVTLPARAVLGAAFLLMLPLAWFSTGLFPNSGDEYGYLYLAQTLLHGRLWNPPPPVPDLFDFFYIWQRDGKLFSQYPPGWPAFLVPFVRLGVPQLAGPLLGLLTGAALIATLEHLRVAADTTAALAALILLSPFFLFTGASYFNHMQAAALVMAICWLQLRDETRGSPANRIAIGVAFSALLLTRYEVFAILFVLYVADRLWHRRWGFLRDAVSMALGGLPLSLCLLGYDWAITGHAFVTTQGWGDPDFRLGLHGMGVDGPNYISKAIYHEFYWTSELFTFAGAASVLLYGGALLARLRRHSLRYFDLLLPATAVFFLFFPDDGGHQYGPRYWFFAWPPMALTIGAAVVESGGTRALLGRPVQLPALAALQTALFLGFVVAYAPGIRMYFDARRAVLDAHPPILPAVVLLPTRDITVFPLQLAPWVVSNRDFTRNGIDFDAPVLFGRDNGPDFTRLACTLPGRTVYRWLAPGQLTPIDCTRPNG